MIGMVDEFVLFDEVQFTRRDWRNRNQIKTPQGLLWLSIPVVSKGKYEQKISDTRISEPGWAKKHWKSIKHAYGKAACFEEVGSQIEKLYEEVSSMEMLSDVNRLFIERISAMLGIDTPISNSADYRIVEGKSERLRAICVEAGADVYISGPAARDYLDEKHFAESGIAVEWMDYTGYPEYPQLHGDFEHHVSIFDLLLNAGPKAAESLRRSG